MKGIFLTLSISAVFIACKPHNEDFNPFDNEFEFHQNFKLSDYDTVWGECGYWNFTNRNNGTYYQFYLGEKDIVAKGFNIDFDQQIFINPDTTDDYRVYSERVYLDPIDTNLVKKCLLNLKIEKVRFIYDSSRIPSIEIIDSTDSIRQISLSGYFSINEFSKELKLVRQISYYNDKPY